MTTLPHPNVIVTNTVSNASIQVAAVNPTRLGLQVFNPSSTITLWVAPLGTNAVANGPGSFAIQPLQGVMFGPPIAPPWTNGMNAIASQAGANQIVIYEY